MSRFSGKLGFVMTNETEEGVWLENFVELPVKGTIPSHQRDQYLDGHQDQGLH